MLQNETITVQLNAMKTDLVMNLTKYSRNWLVGKELTFTAIFMLLTPWLVSTSISFNISGQC